MQRSICASSSKDLRTLWLNKISRSLKKKQGKKAQVVPKDSKGSLEIGSRIRDRG